MTNITVTALWAKVFSTGLLGTHSGPLNLQVDLHNNIGQRIVATEVRLVSTIFFFFPITILRQTINVPMTSHGTNAFSFNVQQLINRFGSGKTFKLVVTDNRGGSSKSDKISI
ncbi:MAG: hypothetical protein ACXVNM_00640 [Bacteroidia bacterium]